jgi:CBS domain-containing protein
MELAICPRSIPAERLLTRGVYVGSATLDPNDAATYALTDFHRESPISVPADRPIDEAFGDMNRLGIHALLVTRSEPGGEERMLGLLTSYRIKQRRADARRLPPELRAHGALSVGEIMTPWHELALLKYASLEYLRVIELAKMFQGSGLTHVLVVEADGDDSLVARGLISRAAIAICLGRSSRPGER